MTFKLTSIFPLIQEEMVPLIKGWQIWLKNIKNYAVNTTEAYLQDIKCFFEFLNKINEHPVNLEDLQIADYAIFRGWLAARKLKKISASSNARAASALRRLYRYLEKSYKVENSAIFTLETGKKKQRLPKALSLEDIKTLLSSINDKEEWIKHRNLSLLLLLYGTGLRISEALNIKVSDFTSNSLKVVGKGNKERMVPLLPLVKEAVETYIKLCPFLIDASDSYLFLGKKGNKLSRNNFAGYLLKLRAMSNIPQNITAHSLRHSFATHLLSAGANLRSIQELLGHANLSTTELYTTLAPTKLAELHKKFHPHNSA